jgi:hypothetical protein
MSSDLNLFAGSIPAPASLIDCEELFSQVEAVDEANGPYLRYKFSVLAATPCHGLSLSS